MAPNLGPVLGGVLADLAGWRWIFSFLVIISGICLVVICLFFPETARNVVGNGSQPPKGIHQNLFSVVRTSRHNKSVSESTRPAWRMRDLNIFSCLGLILRKDTAPVLWTNSVFYMIYCCVQASLSNVFITIYHYSELKAGLVYLPLGFGCALASYLSGNWCLLIVGFR